MDSQQFAELFFVGALVFIALSYQGKKRIRKNKQQERVMEPLDTSRYRTTAQEISSSTVEMRPSNHTTSQIQNFITTTATEQDNWFGNPYLNVGSEGQLYTSHSRGEEITSINSEH